MDFYSKCCERLENKRDLIKLKEELVRKIDKLNLNLKYLFFKEDNFSHVAFVYFQTHKMKNQYLSLYPNSLMGIIWAKIEYILTNHICCCFISQKIKIIKKKRSKLTVKQATSPEDIIWENLKYSLMERICRKLIAFMFTLIILFFGFLIVKKATKDQVKIIKNRLKMMV